MPSNHAQSDTDPESNTGPTKPITPPPGTYFTFETMEPYINHNAPPRLEPHESYTTDPHPIGSSLKELPKFNEPLGPRYYSWHPYPWDDVYMDPLPRPMHVPREQLRHACPLPLLSSPADPPPTTTRLGALDRLPDELKLEILEQVPVAALMLFRNVNRYARLYVDSIPKYKLICKYCPHVLRGTLLVDSSEHIDLDRLYCALEQHHCNQCGELGQHFWLPTASRLCYNCAENFGWLFAPCLYPEKEVQAAREKNGILFRGLTPVISWRFIPGTFAYRYDTIPYRLACHFRERISYCSPSDLMENLGVGKPGRNRSPYRKAREDIRAITDRWYHAASKLGIYSREMELPDYSLLKVMSTVVAPWISHDGEESGVLCAACMSTGELGYKAPVYTRAGFLEHLMACRVRPLELVDMEGKEYILMVDTSVLPRVDGHGDPQE